MKNKLMCLLLAMAMLLSCFAAVGCSNGEDELVEGDDSASETLTTATITLWIPTDESTTPAAILAVQDAMNKVLKPKYDTAVELHAIPSDEYEAAITARFEEIEDAILNGDSSAEEKKEEAEQLASQTSAETEAAAETYINDIGMTVIKYPEVGATQMDLFLVRGYENYLNYYDNGWLTALDTEMTTTGKQLSKYIYPAFLTHAKLDGKTYAIPNNHPIGEYKYLLVNKRLVDELYWDADKLTSIPNCIDFIKDVQTFTDVTPFLAPVEAPGLRYWSEDGSWSLLATQLASNATYGTDSPPKHIFQNTGLSEYIYLMKHLEETNGFAADPANCEEFAVGVVSGDITVKDQYEEDYYVHVYEYPRATEDDLYGNMFAVSVYTKSLTRSMQILTCLNTDPELRTILQYGVEGVHWRENEKDDSVIDIISSDYKMNLLETGNVYMTYPGAGIPMSYWEGAKEQNLTSLIDPYLDFGPDVYITDGNRALFEELAEVSKDYYDEIEAMTAEEFREQAELLKKRVNTIPIIRAKLLSQTNEETSLLLQYRNRK
ncbi:MAG: hypothetical protein IJZ08_02065 [Clostridia bacterium]|nr:hypothetical protein [Clostridia bacterium]